jgi:hypothetical protein
MNNLRLTICELLLRLIVHIAPANEAGKDLIINIRDYALRQAARFKKQYEP